MGIDAELATIEKSCFFSKMGVLLPDEERIISIENVRKVFVEPSELDFKGCYDEVEWLPTSPTQDDPFYELPKSPKELTELRIKINKAVMAATKSLEKNSFLCAPHDFSVAARNGICFAFRQYVSERYYGLGDHWKEIVEIYYKGHWPIGFTKDKLVVI
ncbi:hypothetical protein ACDH53_26515 [Pseudomonas tremae]|uniref:Uncharacterized protein n=2 Tax=Pseudomonas syringae group TaxID=136849 RepID=A0AB37QF36_9PSED|nr:MULTISPECIES: hypothetical protein [Pseudomonas syringae group]MCF5715940.1 hypothetical protein [Pseudomonas tremae]RMR93545.1 hypothetical protein ALP74_200131 [Pseudomonas coronafaciens pv. garcae]UQB31468.1 hypothetical protein I9H06_24910 [Pseudomonas tremae]